MKTRKRQKQRYPKFFIYEDERFDDLPFRYFKIKRDGANAIIHYGDYPLQISWRRVKRDFSDCREISAAELALLL